jgi:hypothetical protein
MNRIEDNDQVFEPDPCAQIQEEEAHYYHTLMDFLDAGRSQGFYCALSELIDLCPVYDREPLLIAITKIAKEL